MCLQIASDAFLHCNTLMIFLFTSQSCLCYPGTSGDFRWDSSGRCKY